MSTDASTVAQIAIAIVIGLAGTSFGLKKLLKEWKQTDAETSVITLMHTELERMSAQNSLLAAELNKLQLEIIKLTKELHILTVENQKLNTEIEDLRKHIARLQSILPGAREI